MMGKEEADQQTSRPGPPEQSSQLEDEDLPVLKDEAKREGPSIIPGSVSWSGSWMPYETEYSVLCVVVTDSGLDGRKRGHKINAARGTVNQPKQAIGFLELRV
jgi:hypothetical protein